MTEGIYVQATLQYFLDNLDEIARLTLEHVVMTSVAVGLGILIALPLGILAARVPRLSLAVTWVAGIGQTVPSLALLGLLMPLFGIGTPLAVAALTVRSVLPILINTYVGVRTIDASVVEAARGMGMTELQRLVMVDLPLAAPAIAAGVRTAAVHCISIATLAAFIGAGGLGDMIFQGIAQGKNEQLLAGIVPAAALAFAADLALGGVERLVTPRGIRS